MKKHQFFGKLKPIKATEGDVPIPLHVATKHELDGAIAEWTPGGFTETEKKRHIMLKLFDEFLIEIDKFERNNGERRFSGSYKLALPINSVVEYRRRLAKYPYPEVVVVWERVTQRVLHNGLGSL